MEVLENNLPEEPATESVTEPVKQPSKAIKTIRGILTSKLFLFIVICQTITMVTQIIAASQNTSIFTELLGMLEGMEIDGLEMLNEFSQMIDSTLFFFALIGMIPAILLTVSYCLFYIGDIKNDDSLCIKGGYSLMAFALINGILPLLYLILIFIAAISLIMLEVDIAIVIMLALIIGGPIFMVYFYYLKLSQTATGITWTFKTEKNVCRISSYVVFCNWVVAIVGIIGALTSISSDFMAFLSGIISSACLIIVTNMLSKYKKQEGIPTEEDLKMLKKK